MGEQGIRDLDSKRRRPRQLTDAEREQVAKDVLPHDEQQVFLSYEVTEGRKSLPS
jgi:hypothetical protein